MSLLPAWIADPALRPTWTRVAARLGQAGLVPQGSVRIRVASREERQAVGDLLGRTLTGETVKIDLATLDHRLRERSGVGGLDAVLRGLGIDLEDRPAVRAAKTESRQRPLSVAAAAINAAWVPDWIDGLRRTGLLTNRENAESIARAAALVLEDLTGSETRSQSRVELGARLLGDAHALDRDRLLHHVVLRGLAAAAVVPVPTNGRNREALWAQFGVDPDLLSRTCLLRGLRIDGDSPIAARLEAASLVGDPVHVTEWDFRQAPHFTPAPGTRVLVCENPRVIEGLAERGVDGWAAVCMSGEPNLVVDKVLSNLARSGVELRYHGDFDWPGVAIANRAIERYGVVPWRMTADDYTRAVRADGLRLGKAAVEPVWDSELGAAMRTRDRAVHEESVLVELVDALGCGQ
ncbi:TIGR02679 family protein [Nocardioides sp. YIM 152315]|uniref:TIGR02679 family protein n=1 Tax=Nocardioides sp. YIM 152315 TaxID=3031760 RepID=UPI0023DC2C6E|nr:TIGR02679 family protein [Nocardioides sp. YIM 152315]MDF1604063.1 TIGR02679 family protein [Nocardioides sp. YIM 152315]